jgi:putative tryptophan/tyrosine transport system substrate-binding protein
MDVVTFRAAFAIGRSGEKRMRRRDFIMLLFGTAAAWPLGARAQQAGGIRRIGVLMSGLETGLEGQTYIPALREGLQKLGWNDGRNVTIDLRWGAADPERHRAHAAELVSSKPDVMVAGWTSALTPLKQATPTIPIVFIGVSDPIGGGFVSSIPHPGGNITGFALYPYTIAVKYLELLKELAPQVNRVGALHDPANRTSLGQLPEVASRAASFGVQFAALPVRNGAEIEQAVGAFASAPSGGLIVLGNPVHTANRELMIALAAKHRLPVVYPDRFDVTSGGLAFYGVDVADLYRRAASYVDRILKGEKPGDLPVQYAERLELVINLKTAKALGLDPPILLLARTDELIE